MRQTLKGLKELRDALRANNGEMTHAEVKRYYPSLISVGTPSKLLGSEG